MPDALCPLMSVGCVFDNSQIWVNIQITHDPSKLDYQFENRKLWKPFFTPKWDKSRYIETMGITNKLHYFEMPGDYYIIRAQKMERIIEHRFRNWRHLPTRWDLGICKILRDCLFNFELHKQGKTIDKSNDIEKVRDIYDGMYGFPLNLADSGDDDFLKNSDKNPIVSAVKNTAVHENENPTARFARAVVIYPYHNKNR
eukprot:TRINITY_DN16607_c0_g1_i1.p1 TRINITY_DN16607_c0_g1~~TRINITY_DN16607_c0_g1_i1.p1  ORF type:complete len:199 (+),score=29.33 TRINITY_DN16607_c0_g1_i1:381-977(+)